MALQVSVIIPAYNRADLIGVAVRSALAQEPTPPAEVIVVDDASSDDTARAARAAGATVIRHEANTGEGAARNTAMAAATQPWLALLDSDDEWTVGHLHALWAHRAGNVLIATSAVTFGDQAAGDVIGSPISRPLPLRSPARILFPENPVVASAAMVRRDVALDVGGFRPLPGAADADLWVRVLERGPGLVLPDVTMRYRVHPAQVTQDRGAVRGHYANLSSTYADRSWSSPWLAESMRVVGEWDRLRALPPGDTAGRAAGALWLARRPRRLRALGRLLRTRASLRRRSTAR